MAKSLIITLVLTCTFGSGIAVGILAARNSGGSLSKSNLAVHQPVLCTPAIEFNDVDRFRSESLSEFSNRHKSYDPNAAITSVTTVMPIPNSHGIDSSFLTSDSTPKVPTSCSKGKGCNIGYRISSSLLASFPNWDEWNYPNAEITSKNIGGEGSTGFIQFGNEQSVVMSTSDSVEKVWEHYRNKLGLKEEGDKSGVYAIGFTNGPGEITFYIGDRREQYTQPLPKRENSEAKMFSLDSRLYHLVVVMYRANSDKATTIVVTYRPNKEFISVLKQIVQKDDSIAEP